MFLDVLYWYRLISKEIVLLVLFISLHSSLSLLSLLSRRSSRLLNAPHEHIAAIVARARVRLADFRHRRARRRDQVIVCETCEL